MEIRQSGRSAIVDCETESGSRVMLRNRIHLRVDPDFAQNNPPEIWRTYDIEDEGEEEIPTSKMKSILKSSEVFEPRDRDPLATIQVRFRESCKHEDENQGNDQDCGGFEALPTDPSRECCCTRDTNREINHGICNKVLNR